jgi:hypothetical protein
VLVVGERNADKREANYSLEGGGNLHFQRPFLASFVVRCGSKNHDLLVAQCDHRIDAHGAARRNPARQNRDAS